MNIQGLRKAAELLAILNQIDAIDKLISSNSVKPTDVMLTIHGYSVRWPTNLVTSTLARVHEYVIDQLDDLGVTE